MKTCAPHSQTWRVRCGCAVPACQALSQGCSCPHSVSACKLTDEACFILYEFWQDVTSWRRLESFLVRGWVRMLRVGGLKGDPTAPPPCAARPAAEAARPSVSPGLFAVETGVNTPIRAVGQEWMSCAGWCKSSPVPPCVGEGPSALLQPRGTHNPCALLTLHAVLQPLAVQLQQDFPAVHHQLAGVPGAADHHALPR